MTLSTASFLTLALFLLGGRVFRRRCENEEKSTGDRYLAPRRQRAADLAQRSDLRRRTRSNALVERRLQLEEVFPAAEDSSPRMARTSERALRAEREGPKAPRT